MSNMTNYITLRASPDKNYRISTTIRPIDVSIPINFSTQPVAEDTRTVTEKLNDLIEDLTKNLDRSKVSQFEQNIQMHYCIQKKDT